MPVQKKSSSASSTAAAQKRNVSKPQKSDALESRQAKLSKSAAAGDSTSNGPTAAAKELSPLERLIGHDFDLDSFITSAEQSMKSIQDEMDRVDREFHRKMRELECDKFDAKKSHYESRKQIISTNHADFWQKMFLYNPAIEMHLNIDAKSPEVEKIDLSLISSLQSVEVQVQKVDKDFYETKLILHLDPTKNDLLENSEIWRSVTIPLNHPGFDASSFEVLSNSPAATVDSDKNSGSNEKDSDAAADKIQVKCSELKMKQGLRDVLAGLEKENVDMALMPFCVQFTDKDYPLMNQFVGTMKQIYSNPTLSLKLGIEEEQNYQLAMASSDEEDEDDEEELSEIDEEEEDEQEEEEEEENEKES